MSGIGARMLEKAAEKMRGKISNTEVVKKVMDQVLPLTLKPTIKVYNITNEEGDWIVVAWKLPNEEEVKQEISK